jgi:hypothetical protein
MVVDTLTSPEANHPVTPANPTNPDKGFIAWGFGTGREDW